MALIDLWRSSQQQVYDKQVQQLISFAGEGQLRDGSKASAEFRELLGVLPATWVRKYVEECLTAKFENSGFALQDLTNEVGRRLGFSVRHGRYRGTQGELGFDGLWTAPEGNHVVIEVKTTDAYRISLETVAGYRSGVIAANGVKGEDVSILIIVGRQDTGDLEAQIRGSKHAWDVRLISADALLRLVAIKDELEDPSVETRIRQILIPREYTRVDEIIDLVFTTTADIKQSEVTPLTGEAGSPAGAPEEDGSRTPPVSFNEECASVVSAHLGIPLVRRSRVLFESNDGHTGLVCAVSKEHGGNTPNYWFAFHPHQEEALGRYQNPFLALGCGSPELVFLFPFKDFRPLLEGMHTTTREDGRTYWHVQIFDREKRFFVRGRKGVKDVEITDRLIARLNG